MRYKKNIFGPLLLLAALATGTVSCARLILEERRACPAFLFFDITNSELFDMSEYTHVSAYKYPEQELLAIDTTSVSSTLDRSFYLEVKRSDSVTGYGLLCFGGARHEGTLWTVEPGQEFPPVWRFGYSSPALTESYIIPVEAVKDHARVDMRFVDADGYADTGGEFPYYIVARSNTCGIDALDGRPVKGAFRFEPSEYGSGRFRFTVPRQFDRSLHIEVWGRDGFREAGKLVTDIVVWNLLRSDGDFSWEAKNLPDIQLEVCLVENRVTISVMEWSGETHSVYNN